MEDNRVFPTVALCVAVRHFSKKFWEIYFCNSFKASIQGVKQRLDSKSLSRSMFLEILQEYVQERVPEMFPGMQFLKRYNPPKLSWMNFKKKFVGGTLWNTRHLTLPPLLKNKYLTRLKSKVISLVFIMILLLFRYALHCIIDSSVYIEDPFKILFRLTQ